MAKKVWKFTLEDGNHVVELDDAWWSAKKCITVDGVPIESSSKRVHHLLVSGVPCILLTGVGFSWKHDLYVNGKLVRPTH